MQAAEEEGYELVQHSPVATSTSPEAEQSAYYDRRYGVLIAGKGSPSTSPSSRFYLQLAPKRVGRKRWMLAGPLGFMLLCGGLLASVCLVVPLAMISLSYGTVIMDPQETRILHTNSMFTRGVMLEDPTDAINMYRLDYTPKLLDKKDHTKFKEQLLLPASSHKMFKHHLNRGSSFTVQFSSNVRTHMYIFAGDRAYSRWVGDHSDRTWQFERQSQGNTQQKLDYNVKKHENAYFIVFANLHESKDAEILLNYEIKRTVYDLSKEEPTCGADTGTTTCWFNIHLFDDRVLVVEARDAVDDTSDEKFRFSWGMYPRWWIYISLLAVPLFYLLACVMPACCGWPCSSSNDFPLDIAATTQYDPEPYPPKIQLTSQPSNTSTPQRLPRRVYATYGSVEL